MNTLSKQGYKTLEAGDGVEALAQFDGRTIDRYKYIPVLVLSTEINQNKKERAQAARITGWIAKPFDLERFIKIIEKSLR